MLIKTVFDFNRELKRGQHAMVGGYPTYFITADGAVLSWQAAKEEQALIRDSIINYPFDGECIPRSTDGWRVVTIEINFENKNLYCDHTGEKIESAYE